MAAPWKPHLLKVFFSNRYVYAAVLHKTAPSDPGHFVASASSLQQPLKSALAAAGRPAADRAAAADVGRLLAERVRALTGSGGASGSGSSGSSGGSPAGGSGGGGGGGGAAIEALHFERRKGRRFTGKLAALVRSIRRHGVQVH